MAIKLAVKRKGFIMEQEKQAVTSGMVLDEVQINFTRWNLHRTEHPLREAMLEGCQRLSLSLLEGKEKVEEINNPQAWTRKTIYNQAMSFLKEQSVRRSMVDDRSILLPRKKGGYDAASIRKKAFKVLHSEREKHAYKAFFEKEKSVQDMADILKISHSASARLKKRIIGKLATCKELQAIFHDITMVTSGHVPEPLALCILNDR